MVCDPACYGLAMSVITGFSRFGFSRSEINLTLGSSSNEGLTEAFGAGPLTWTIGAASGLPTLWHTFVFNSTPLPITILTTGGDTLDGSINSVLPLVYAVIIRTGTTTFRVLPLGLPAPVNAAQIQTQNVSSATPTDGQALVFDGSVPHWAFGSSGIKLITGGAGVVFPTPTSYEDNRGAILEIGAGQTFAVLTFESPLPAGPWHLWVRPLATQDLNIAVTSPITLTGPSILHGTECALIYKRSATELHVLVFRLVSDLKVRAIVGNGTVGINDHGNVLRAVLTSNSTLTLPQESGSSVFPGLRTFVINESASATLTFVTEGADVFAGSAVLAAGETANVVRLVGGSPGKWGAFK